MRHPSSLLLAAERLYDDERHGLAAQARWARWRGFSGGAVFMARVLAILRACPRPAPVPSNIERLGILKYALATLPALACVALSFRYGLWWLLPAVPLFYVVESQLGFALPLAIDGASAPLAGSVALTRRIGRASVWLGIMAIAWHMLSGGMRGRGFLRSWCAGCIAVLLWYERSRTP